jgi:hypothetical protein
MKTPSFWRSTFSSPRFPLYGGIGLFVAVGLCAPLQGTKSTGRQAECLERVAALRARASELAPKAQEGDSAALSELEAILEPAFIRYSTYYHRLLPGLSEETLRAAGREALRTRIAGPTIAHADTRKLLSDCIGRGMRRLYENERGISASAATATRRLQSLMDRLKKKTRRNPSLAIMAAAARVSPDFVRERLKTQQFSDPPATPSTTLVSSKESQLAAIDAAKGQAQTRQTLGLLVLKLRKLKLNDVSMAIILNRENMPSPEGTEWSAELTDTLAREIWGSILSRYSNDSLPSRGTQNQLILELIETGFSFRETAVLFNENSIPSPSRSKWSHNTIGRRYKEAYQGILVRTNVPEKMGWHGPLAEEDIQKILDRIDSEVEPLTPEQAMLVLRRHGLELRVITDRLNALLAENGEPGPLWHTGSVNRIIHEEQRSLVEEFLSSAAPDLAGLKDWCVRFDLSSVPPREVALLIAYVFPEYASEFTDVKIAQRLAMHYAQAP